MIKDRDDAHHLLKSLGASKRLILHLQLVGAVADELARHLRTLGVPIDDELVRLGAVCHDAGKIVHPNELDEPGSLHEAAGERLLLDHGVAPDVARCCLSHARYEHMDVTLEELLVALADKLWKGNRVTSLELRVIDSAAELLDVDRWAVFARLDALFERIAAGGRDASGLDGVSLDEAGTVPRITRRRVLHDSTTILLSAARVRQGTGASRPLETGRRMGTHRLPDLADPPRHDGVRATW